jgi:hypothetical protein
VPHRKFLDGNAREWQVWDVRPTASEHRASTVAAGFESGWLCFECAGEKRRLAPIPPGWPEYPDGDLQHCPERARPATQTNRDPDAGGPTHQQ